jgi:hypothetical protein
MPLPAVSHHYWVIDGSLKQFEWPPLPHKAALEVVNASGPSLSNTAPATMRGSYAAAAASVKTEIERLPSPRPSSRSWCVGPAE